MNRSKDKPDTAGFELQPTLVGELLELRPLMPTDFDALFRAASDPLIWELHPENDRYQPEIFRRYFDGAIESGGAFAIIDRASGQIIGSSRYYDLNTQAREVEIGWTFLQRAYWGGRYNRELKRLMLDHAFRFVDRVLFIAGEQNLRSRRALEKIGAKFVRRQNRPSRTGTIVPNVVYALDKTSSKF